MVWLRVYSSRIVHRNEETFTVLSTYLSIWMAGFQFFTCFEKNWPWMAWYCILKKGSTQMNVNIRSLSLNYGRFETTTKWPFMKFQTRSFTQCLFLSNSNAGLPLVQISASKIKAKSLRRKTYLWLIRDNYYSNVSFTTLEWYHMVKFVSPTCSGVYLQYKYTYIHLTKPNKTVTGNRAHVIRLLLPLFTHSTLRINHLFYMRGIVNDHHE